MLWERKVLPFSEKVSIKLINFSFWLLLFVGGYGNRIPDGFSEVANPEPSPSEALDQQLLQVLNNQLQTAGEKNDYIQAESIMDQMIGLMERLHLPEAEIKERALLRIQFSQSVGRINTAAQAVQKWVEKYPQDWEAQSRLSSALPECLR